MNTVGVDWGMQNQTWPYNDMLKMDSVYFDGEGKKAQETSQSQEAILEVLLKTMILFSV